MRRWLTHIDTVLAWAGEAVTRVWLPLLGLAILLSFPVAGIALSLVIGWEAARWIGGGLWTFLAVAFVFGLFLSIYVWSRYVEATTRKLADLIQRSTPD
jgi:membrane protein implicated in regulation of membrane protease activity